MFFLEFRIVGASFEEVDKGAIQMKVLAKDGNRVECEVLTEGTLGSRRHINLPGVKVNLPALTPKDVADVTLGLELGVDYIALSFVRRSRAVRPAATRLPHEREKKPWPPTDTNPV